MSISSFLSIGSQSMEASSWRKEAHPAIKAFATPGAPVKADEVSLSGRAKKILQADAKALRPDPEIPVCYGPGPKLTNAAGETGADDPVVCYGPKPPIGNHPGFKVSAEADIPVCYGPDQKPKVRATAGSSVDAELDIPICYGPKIDKHTKIDSKITAIDEKNVKELDLPGKDDDVVTPPRTRQEAWADGWRNLGAATRRLMELVEMAKNPGLSTTERAKLNEEFKAIVDQVDSYAKALVEEQGLTGGTAQIWRNSVGSKELFIDGNDNLLTAESVQTLSDKLAKRSEVVFRTMRYLGVA
jgi:hypothetical protein